MIFVPYVYDRDGERVAVSITPMTQSDASLTEMEPKWQTPWTSEYLITDDFEKYAVRIGDELIALGAYEIQENALIVHIVYMESNPESDPMSVKEPNDSVDRCRRCGLRLHLDARADYCLTTILRNSLQPSVYAGWRCFQKVSDTFQSTAKSA